MMTIQITDIPDEAGYNAYLAARDAPRYTITLGVRPNSIKAVNEYDWLITALSGGDEAAAIPDMSAYATYHGNVTAQVTPFIELMRCCMKVLRDTPALINQGARAQGQFPPFGEAITDEVDPTEYGQLLSGTVAAIQAVGAALGGGE